MNVASNPAVLYSAGVNARIRYAPVQVQIIPMNRQSSDFVIDLRLSSNTFVSAIAVIPFFYT